jgi:hypothetical protein
MGTSRTPATQGHGVSSHNKGAPHISLPCNHLKIPALSIPIPLTHLHPLSIPHPYPAYISLPAVYPLHPPLSKNG